MASSRKRRPKPDPADGILLSALRRALDLAREAALPAPAAPAPRAAMSAQRRRVAPPRRGATEDGAPLILAYSGGPDSTVLLDLACRLRDAGAAGFGALRAVHVHHGLQDDADAWVAHCQRECAARALALDVVQVRVQASRGLEDGARTARYGALARAAVQAGARFVLTAHNADDRIETFLLQWLRGAGLEGLAGIAETRALEHDAGGPALQLLRPLLETPRRQIEEYLQRHELSAVEDPSNANPRFARNALRLQVLPPLARIRAGFRKSGARSIELIGEAAEVLQQIASADLAACTEDAPPRMLRLDRLAALAPARRPLVLRAWLAQHGEPAPSRARLLEALAQALGAGRDGRMLVRLGAQELRRHGGLLLLRPAGPARRPAGSAVPFTWQGESEVVVGGWGGVLRFHINGAAAAAPGFDPAWLRACPLEVRGRTGGERFKPHSLRPSRRLKHLFQELGVPEFERAALPLLWRDGRLIFVAGLGGDARWLEPGPGRVRIEWSGEPSLLGS